MQLKTEKLLELIHCGTIIRMKNDNIRDWVLTHTDKINLDILTPIKRGSNYLPYVILGDMYYDGDPMTDIPYCKCAGQLTKGALNNIKIVGDINNKNDFNDYKLHQKL